MEVSDVFFSEANDEFVNENYQSAVDLYTKAITANGNKSVYFTNRAHAYFKLEEFEKAIEDTENSITLDSGSVKAFLRKGICQFELKKYEEALNTFQRGQQLDSKNETFEVWLKSCREKLGLPEPDQHNSVPNSHENEALEESDQPAAAAAAATTTPTPPPPPHTKKYDWYQTQTHTVITILVKHVKHDDIKVDFSEKTFSLQTKLPSDEEYSLQLNLAHMIIPDQCQTKVTPTKIEVKLKKRDSIHWNKLEASPDNNTPLPAVISTESKENSTSCFRDWEKIVKDVAEEEKNEKPEGDAALNHLFQQIYADGSDDVKRAMVKSYVESGGTVLSTNWTEVGEKAVDVKPPSGMEYKQWEV